MKILLSTICLFLAGWMAKGESVVNKHDFVSQAWANGRSCAVCHQLKRGVPPSLPPEARTLQVGLSAEETEALNVNPQNRLCFYCHSAEKLSKRHGEIVSTIRRNQDGSTGNCTPAQSRGGTHGTICARVNNEGSKRSDCLTCHDVHNFNTSYLLREDFGKEP